MSKEIERIYESILTDFQNAGENVDVEEWLKSQIKKRLLIDDEKKIEEIIQGLYSGILKYRETQNYLKDNPEIFKKLKEKLKEVAEDFKELADDFIKSIKNLKGGNSE